MQINTVQRLVFSIVMEWNRKNKTPIHQKTILENLSTVPQSTIKASIKALIRKGYMRKAMTVNRSVAYVQLRSL